MRMSEDARTTALLLATTILAAKQLTATFQDDLKYPSAFAMMGCAVEPVRKAFRLADIILQEIEQRSAASDIFTDPRWDKIVVNGEVIRDRKSQT